MSLRKEYRVFQENGIFLRKCNCCNSIKNLKDYPLDKTKVGKLTKEGYPLTSLLCTVCFFEKHGKTKRYLNSVENEKLLKQGNRKCSKCNEIKSVSDFWRNNTTTGMYSACSYCELLRTRGNQIKNRTKDKEAAKRYNITLNEYDKLIKENCNCQICGIELQNPHIDHDHITGKVRGVLCKKCNTGIGMLQDNVNILKNAISYLELFQFSLYIKEIENVC